MSSRHAVDGPMPPVTIFTFFLEVGRFLPVPETQFISHGARTDAWAGWTPQLLSRMLTRDKPPGFADTVPGQRTTFRHFAASDRPPLYAAEGAYFDWIAGVITDAETQRRIAMRERYGSTVKAWQTVVALSRFIPETEHPASEQMTIRWLTREFRTSLDVLNRTLDHLSFAASDWAVGSVERRDLPSGLPVLIQSTHADEHQRARGSTFVMRLHDDDPVPYTGEDRTPEVSVDALAHALAISNAGNHGALPFEQVFRFLRAADSERIGGDPTRSVVDLATAFELLIFELLASGGPALGWPAEKVWRATKDSTQLRGRVEAHLAAMLGAHIDVTDTGTVWGRWWAEGYERRVGAVHRGERIDEDGCQTAYEAAVDLIEHITKLLQLQPQLHPLATALAELRLGRSEPPWLDRELPVTIDWF